MNWLAHLLLSEPTPEDRIAAILPDLVSAPALIGMHPRFQPGIQQHRRIDAYTDSHPVFRRSVQRLDPPFRRYGGILIDVFYDHFLSRDWRLYSDVPLPEFAAEIYSSFESHRSDIPPEINERLEQMKAGNLFCSYGELSGVTDALRRISSRLRRSFDLVPSVSFLEHHSDSFHADFASFFPELVGYVSSKASIRESHVR